MEAVSFFSDALKIPSEISSDLAEVVGVHLGDGCMVRYFGHGGTINEVAFTANASEYDYYNTFLQPTIESTFEVRGRLFLRRDDNTTRYVIYSKELVAYFLELGIPLGRKRDASIPRILFEQGKTVPCIRGIYHAEGSIYRRYSKAYKGHARVYDDLLTLQIRTKLKTLMNQVHAQLSNLGVFCNRLTEKDGVYTLRITRQTEIAKFMEKIQPRFKLRPLQ